MQGQSYQAVAAEEKAEEEREALAQEKAEKLASKRKGRGKR